MTIKTIKTFDLEFIGDTVSSATQNGRIVVSSIVFISEDFFQHFSNLYVLVTTVNGSKHYVSCSNLNDLIS